MEKEEEALINPFCYCVCCINGGRERKIEEIQGQRHEREGERREKQEITERKRMVRKDETKYNDDKKVRAAKEEK